MHLIGSLRWCLSCGGPLQLGLGVVELQLDVAVNTGDGSFALCPKSSPRSEHVVVFLVSRGEDRDAGESAPGAGAGVTSKRRIK